MIIITKKEATSNVRSGGNKAHPFRAAYLILMHGSRYKYVQLMIACTMPRISFCMCCVNMRLKKARGGSAV